MKKRKEKDFLGEKEISALCYWGIHTQRAKENFVISGYPVKERLIKAYAKVKRAAALANWELGYLSPRKAQAIVESCWEIEQGQHKEQFMLDALQGGAGTSTNMNLNEVIANLALEKLGRKKGEYQYLDPLQDVNLNQSTNDTYPTALRLSLLQALGELEEKVRKLQRAFQKKEKEFFPFLKIGRTQLQPAVPLSLGGEFSAFSEAIARDRWRIFKAQERLRVANLGGTAIGTGLGAPRRYIFLVWERLQEISRLNICRSENLVDATANADSFSEASGIIKTHALNLVKICNDLRRLNLLGEIEFAFYQAGSSIMPGKNNPVILEAALQAGLKVKANDLIISDCVSCGTFQINEFLPLLGFAFLESLEILINTDEALSSYVEKIKACPDNCLLHFSSTPRLITAFLPQFGYHKLEEILAEYEQEKGENFLAFITKKLGRKNVEKYLNPWRIMSLGYEE